MLLDVKAVAAGAAKQPAVSVTDPGTRERLRKQAEEEEYVKQLVHQVIFILSPFVFLLWWR